MHLNVQILQALLNSLADSRKKKSFHSLCVNSFLSPLQYCNASLQNIIYFQQSLVPEADLVELNDVDESVYDQRLLSA